MNPVVKAFIDAMNNLRGPVVGGILLISAIYVGYQVFIGGQDKRVLFNTVIGLLLIATFVFLIPNLITWIMSITGAR